LKCSPLLTARTCIEEENKRGGEYIRVIREEENNKGGCRRIG
jgi:hypothetical protein